MLIESLCLRWPWGKSDGNGSLRLLVCLCLFLIPSAMWIEATLFHMDHGYSWSPAVPITILIAVAVGNLLMLALGVSAYQVWPVTQFFSVSFL